MSKNNFEELDTLSVDKTCEGGGLGGPREAIIDRVVEAMRYEKERMAKLAAADGPAMGKGRGGSRCCEDLRACLRSDGDKLLQLEGILEKYGGNIFRASLDQIASEQKRNGKR